ncbi:unnamed protein product [Lampetra fluviatilis]
MRLLGRAAAFSEKQFRSPKKKMKNVTIEFGAVLARLNGVERPERVITSVAKGGRFRMYGRYRLTLADPGAVELQGRRFARRATDLRSPPSQRRLVAERASPALPKVPVLEGHLKIRDQRKGHST